MTGVARWNFQRLVDLKQPGVRLPAAFDPQLIADLNAVSKRVLGDEKYPALRLSSRDTGERFGLDYVEPGCRPVHLDWEKHRSTTRQGLVRPVSCPQPPSAPTPSTQPATAHPPPVHPPSAKPPPVHPPSAQPPPVHPPSAQPPRVHPPSAQPGSSPSLPLYRFPAVKEEVTPSDASEPLIEPGINNTSVFIKVVKNTICFVLTF